MRRLSISASRCTLPRVQSMVTGARTISSSRPLLSTSDDEVERERKLREQMKQSSNSTSTTGQPLGLFAAYRQTAQWAAQYRRDNGTVPSNEQIQGYLQSAMKGTSEPPKAAGENQSTNNASAGSGKSVIEIHVLLIVYMLSCFMLLNAVFQRVQGFGETDWPYIPFTAVPRDVRAKQLLLNLLHDEGTKTMYQTNFWRARASNPFLTFFQYLDQAYPDWCSGRRFPGGVVQQAIVGTVSMQTDVQTFQVMSTLRGTLDSQGKGLSLTDKADLIVDTLRSNYGNVASSPQQALAANILGATQTGQVPVMKMTRDRDGNMTLTDQNGTALPVQSIEQGVQGGGLTIQPVQNHQSSVSMTDPHGTVPQFK